MVHKKVDNRIRVMIENGVTLGHRSMFFVVGERGRHQVMFLHHMLTKASLRARPNILWCYKSELGFTSHQKKQMKKFQKRYREGGNVNTGESPFELFVLSTNIRYCYYSETHNILGNTFGMCVLQDFEALTPNLLARTIETVDGGGIIVILLKSVSSLKQLYTMTMDVHARYRTEAHQDVVGRFNERFILSLASCKNCMVLDDSLNVLPLSSHTANIKAVQPKSWDDRLSPEEKQLMELKESLQDTQPIGVLVNCCKTVDQAKALLKFVETITDKTLRNTVSLTAARGRGKSAALGLAMAAAVAFSYSNMFVTSPSPENLTTFFEFVFKGFDALGYEEHIDYEIVQSTNKEFHKVVVRVNIFKEHRQTIQYFQPSDANKLSQAELVIIDEAAAIPLPLVKGLLGPYLVFMASTINGYEGTGRSLSLKLVQQLRQQSLTFGNSAADAKSLSDGKTSASGRVLSEIQLNESIRYKNGDIVEAWLNSLLCLDASVVQHLASGCPDPQDCDLYYINRDTLFSYHRASELFLQRLMALYVSSHYKNTPDDLQMMSDAPAHNLFCLLGPVSSSSENKLPEILCVVQVCLEGAISKDSSMRSLTRGKIAAGDLIPWTVAQQFQDTDFPCLSGARIIRIATHPNYQKMGYGTRALELLQQYYEGKITTFDEPKDVTEIEQVTEETIELLHEKIAPRKCLPPLLYKLSERRPEKLDYLGVSYGITHELLKFWKKSGYVPVYLRQTKNDLTGEHSCIMLKVLNSEEGGDYVAWLGGFWNDFRRRFISLLGFQFSEFSSSMALNILTHSVANCDGDVLELTKEELNVYFTNYDLKRLDLYSRNMIDYHLVTDLLPNLAKLYFMQKFNDVGLTHLPACILVGMGLQHKTVDDLSKEIDIAPSQLLAIFNRIIRKFTQYLSGVKEADIANKLFKTNNESVVEEEEPEQEPQPETTTNEDDLPDDDEREASAKKFEEIAELEGINLKQYAIKGSKEDWNKMLEAKGTVSTVCLKSKRKPSKDPLFKSTERFEDKKKEKKKKNKKLKTTFK